MDSGLIAGAHSLKYLEDWQALTAHNLANTSTTGFQKAVFWVEGQSPLRTLDSQGKGLKAGDLMLPKGAAVRPQMQGQLKTTDNPLDFAIHGKGYFALQGPQEETLYTRDGEFHLDDEGILVNKMGYPVMADGGIIQISPDEGPFTMTGDGTISQNGEVLARMTVYHFEHPANLGQGNGSYLRDPEGSAGAFVVAGPTVANGELELSTVQPLSEMVNMIQVSRAYELTQKIIQESDDRQKSAIQTFGA